MMPKISGLKGQIFSFDLVFSLIIFLGIIVFSVYLFGNISSSRLSELENSANIASSKILSKDYASENILNKNLLLNLLSKDYNTQRKALGVLPNNFYMKIVYADTGEIVKRNGAAQSPVAYIANQYPDDVGIMRMLNNTSIVWDFYWESGSSPPVGTTARHTYAIDNKVQAFKWLIGNLSNYNSVISEDTHVKDSDLSSSDKQKLKDFVNAGGLFFHIQHEEELISVFGITPSADAKSKGRVENNDELLVDVPVGTNLTFQQGTKGFSISNSPFPLTALIKSTDVPTECQFCRWDYGSGRIYFIPDMNTTNPNGFVPGLKIAGDTFEFGKKPDNSTHASSSRRISKYGNQYVYLDLVIWQ